MQSKLFKERSFSEREHKLWRASEQYIRGEIEAQVLENIELPYTEDLIDAALTPDKLTYRHGSLWYSLIPLSIALVLIVVGLITFILTENRWALLLPAISIPLIRSAIVR